MQKLCTLFIMLLMFACVNDSKKEKAIEHAIDETTEQAISSDEETSNTKNENANLVTDSVNIESTTEQIEEAKPIEVAKPKSQATPKPAPKPVKQSFGAIYIAEPIHEFGRIKDGAIVKHTFVFENRGKVPLKVKDVLVDCGCTVPEFPKEAIPVGGSGNIEVTFDSKGKIATQERFITILTDGEPRSKIVKLVGIVE